MPTITLQPDATAGIDCYIDEQTSSSNYNDTYLKTGQYDYSYSCSCGTCCNYCSYSCNPYSCNCSTCCNTCTCTCCSACGATSGIYSCGSRVYTYWYSCSAANCSSCGSYSCGCQTCYQTCSGYDCGACGSYTCCSTCWSYNGIYRSFIKFDLSSIPAGATVSSATLTLTRSSEGSGTSVSVHQVTSSWSETTPTWGSPPTYNATELTSATVGTGETSWSVTTAVQNWVNAAWANYGFAIKATNENDYYIFFHSSDSSTASARPKLSVTYNTVPNTPTPVSPSSGASIKRNQSNTFDWTFSDPDSGDSQSAWALKRVTAGTNYWWNTSSSSWQTSEVFNAGTADQYSFGSNTWPVGAHTWSVATKDSQGAAGSYSLARNVNVTSPFGGWGQAI